MKRNMKIVRYLILISLLLFTRQVGATFGRERTAHFPGIFYGEGKLLPMDCSPTAIRFGDIELLFSLYQSVGDLLIQNDAEILMVSSTLSDYFYSLTIHGKEVSKKVDSNDGSDPNFSKHFFQYINDDVLRRLEKNKQGVKLQEVQFPVDGFTIHLGSFETKKEAVKFAKSLDRKLSMTVAKFARNLKAQGDAYRSPIVGGFYGTYSFCDSCLFQDNPIADSDYVDNIAVPSIFLKPYASNDWRVHFGLFVREEDANVATKTVEKFYNGQSVVQKIKIDKEIINKQTLMDCEGKFVE